MAKFVSCENTGATLVVDYISKKGEQKTMELFPICQEGKERAFIDLLIAKLKTKVSKDGDFRMRQILSRQKQTETKKAKGEVVVIPQRLYSSFDKSEEIENELDELV